MVKQKTWYMIPIFASSLQFQRSWQGQLDMMENLISKHLPVQEA